MYAPVRTSVDTAVGILVLGLASIHDAMNDMADGHIDNDKLIAGMFTKPKPADGPANGGVK
ncbi:MULTISPECIES: hypothetical protein [unclassified Streptomyces]|uniref:hypothetical protein n=1 Tax=unclassified Streptomyces TaxID=2593676 RepID=UPI0032D5AD0E